MEAKVKSANTSTNRYLEMGMASLLPGMQYMVEQMQRMLDEFRAELAMLQAGHHGAKARAGKGAWAGKSAEERHEIAKRRWETRRRNAEAADAPRHPHDPRHPGHEAYIAKLRESQQRAWAALSPAAKKAKIRKMRSVGKRNSKSARAAVNELKGAAA